VPPRALGARLGPLAILPDDVDNAIPERHTSGRVELQNPERVPTRFATSERAETL